MIVELLWLAIATGIGFLLGFFIGEFIRETKRRRNQ